MIGGSDIDPSGHIPTAMICVYMLLKHAENSISFSTSRIGRFLEWIVCIFTLLLIYETIFTAVIYHTVFEVLVGLWSIPVILYLKN